MVFFASRHRVKKLPFLQKVWMTPVAYALKYLAGAIIYLADRFDEKVTFALVTNTCKGDVR
jgi:hypothetical protein